MKRLSFILAICVIAVAAVCHAAHPDVVRIRVTEGGGVFSAGSGTLIGVNEQGHGVVLTCWHLFRDSDGPNFVDFPSGERRGATLVHKTQADDLAVLIIADPPSDGTPLSESDMPKGSAATIAGYGGQGQYLAQRGQVVQIASFDEGRSWEARTVTVQARQGDSGGPIFADDGSVCGVISGARDGQTVGTCGPRVWQYVQQCGPGGCPTYCRPRMVPVRPPQIAPRPTVPLPILKEPRRQKPIGGNSAGVELTPARPLLPSGRSDDIQDLKQAVSDLAANVANIEKTLNQQPAKPITDIADLKPVPKGCQCDKPKECDTEKIVAAVVAQLAKDPRFKPAEVDADKIAAAVTKGLPPIQFELIDEDGTKKASKKVPLGGVMKLQVRPVAEK